MGTKNIILIVAGLLVLGVGIWWFTSQSDNDQASQTEEQTTLEAQASSINELLAQNQELMCTFSDTDEQGNLNSGTVYLANGQMSGEFSLSAPDEEPINSYVINDGQAQYMWQEGESEGVKFTLEETDDPDELDTAEESPASVDRDEDYNFSCQEWSADDERFTPPSNVDFIDYSQQIQNAQEEASEALEETCAQITDPDARAACEAVR